MSYTAFYQESMWLPTIFHLSKKSVVFHFLSFLGFQCYKCHPHWPLSHDSNPVSCGPADFQVQHPKVKRVSPLVFSPRFMENHPNSCQGNMYIKCLSCINVSPTLEGKDRYFMIKPEGYTLSTDGMAIYGWGSLALTRWTCLLFTRCRWSCGKTPLENGKIFQLWGFASWVIKNGWNFCSSWWFQPIWKICSSDWIISLRNRGENKTCLKRPPSCCLVVSFFWVMGGGGMFQVLSSLKDGVSLLNSEYSGTHPKVLLATGVIRTHNLHFLGV